MKSKDCQLLLFIICLIIPCKASLVLAQTEALLIIDIQEFYFPGGDMPLDKPVEAALNAALILNEFREEGKLVIHIRHNYEPGGAIISYVKPKENETVISKDNINAFLGTMLDSMLKANTTTDLVLCGMQTHMCLEAATRAASDMGYHCTVIEDACATRDLKYGDYKISAKDVHLATLATLKSYAEIMTSAEYLNSKKGTL